MDFGYAFNSGVLAATQLFKDLDGIKLKAAILAAERTAARRVEEESGRPWEDTLLELEPFVSGIKKIIDEI